MDPVLITIIVYIIGMLLIGYYYYRRNESIEDYFLGGRTLNPYVTALSAQASDMSGWLLMGFPGAVYAGGFNAMWIGIGLALGTYLNWQFTAQRLRRYTEVVDAITIADFFESRFRDKSHYLRIVTALAILIFFTIYVSSGLIAGGILFENILGINYNVAVFLAVIVVGLYTFLGGFKAVSWTDFVQGLLMFIALIIVPIIVISSLGGFDELWKQIAAVNPDLLNASKIVDYNLADRVRWTSLNTGDGFTFISLISLLAWGLGYFGMPHILVRFMGIKSARQLPISQFVGISWVVISLIGAVLVGMMGIVIIPEPLANTETVFLVLLQRLFNPWIAGIFLAAVLAAIMSTIDSQLLVSSSALAEDFYKAIFRPEAGQKELLWVSRATVALITILGLVFALSGGSILDIVAYAWAGLGASFGPAILFSLFWKRTSRNGVLAGIITGGLTVIIWKNFFAYTGLYEIIPGFILAALLIYLISLLGDGPVEEVEKEFEMAMKPLANE
ncbi:sodium/proline symporter PutP [Halocella sp. SP3-1]|uniref:sodium/proline symporter PutP n=1 Tax=Halocella sp. SP3-1 TaxID=2382161 RepID=UPI000F759FD0|nr:sodium/proline symporter PutP [Halocella sp. SP3-1]AZO93389.1 sodium/proline symporter PutP [Halocella sp. SP3-1]